MGLDEQGLRHEWETIRREAVESKFTNEAHLRMARLYREAPASDRAVIEAVLPGWVHSEDALQQFVALALVSDFKIRSARGAVLQLLSTVDSATRGPDGALRKKLESVIESLDSTDLRDGNTRGRPA